jgi:hypothetical protein
MADVSTVESKITIGKGKSNKSYHITSDITCFAILEAIANAGHSMSFKELVDVAGERTLVGLYLQRLCGKSLGLLKRTAPEKKMSDGDLFEFNPSFSFAAAKITIPVLGVDRKAVTQAVVDKSDVDKANTIKSVAVRYLKQKTRITQKALEADIIQGVSQQFKTDTATVRILLTELETSGYMERRPDGNDTICTYKQ